MIFDFAGIAPRDRYKLLSSTIIPRPVAWVSTVSSAGVANAAPFAFFNIFGDDPPVIALGIHNGAHGETDTGRNILDSGEFVVNLVPVAALEKMEVTAHSFPPEISEFDVAGLTQLPSQKVKPPRIAGSPVALECRLFKQVPFSDSRWLAVGEVLLMHVEDGAVLDAGRFHIDGRRLDLVARLGGGSYVRIGEALPQPAGYRVPDNAA